MNRNVTPTPIIHRSRFHVNTRGFYKNIIENDKNMNNMKQNLKKINYY